MENITTGHTIKASRITATTFGVLAGLGGLYHGIGEVLQGNVAPEGLAIFSWTQGPIATNMGGEPGMTIVPNLLITGILCIIVAAAIIAWAAPMVHQRGGGLILAGLSIVMMLVGGGFGPPLIGILAGIAGTRIHAPSMWWRRHLQNGPRRFLASLWPWIFGIAAASGALLVIGSIILVCLFGVNNPDFFLNNFYLTVLLLVLTVLTGIPFDVGNAAARNTQAASIRNCC